MVDRVASGDQGGPPVTPSAGMPDEVAETAVPAPRTWRARLHGWFRQTRWALLAAALGGVAQMVAFPPIGWWPLAPFGVAALLLAVRHRGPRSAAIMGFVFGLAVMVPLLQWLRSVGPDAWLALATIEALYFAPLGAALAMVSRTVAWPVSAACLWVADEWLRGSFPLGGFPWGRLAFAESSAPLVRLASLGGAPLVTFAAALAGGLLACGAVSIRSLLRPRVDGVATRRTSLTVAVRSLLRPHPGHAGLLAGAAVAGALAVTAVGLAVPLRAGHGHAHRVAVVQGDVPRPGLHFLGRREEVLHNHVAETRVLARRVARGKARQPELVVWPENSSDIDPYRNADAYAAISSAARAARAPLLVGVVVVPLDGRRLRNEGIVWDPRGGPAAHYVERHLVPFGEYIPLRGLLSRFITRLRMVPLNYAPGHRPGVLRLGPVRVGDVICYEVAYDGIVRDATLGGGQMLVVQANDATYGTTEAGQQFAMSRLRAVEHDRPVLVAATTGVSGIIGRDGRVVRHSKTFTPAALGARVPAVSGRTLADRVGAWPEWILSAWGILAVTASAVVGRGRRQGG